ncbi:MAG: Crp/Fnr family transcriptional regulator [Hyphomicrobium sp.]|nr:Crp/Fnr family transcriptional regulator [Hyphomicrobium sp.]
MTIHTTQRRRPVAEARLPNGLQAHVFETEFNRLMSDATTVRVRRGQRIAIGAEETECLYVVSTGVLALEVPMQSRTRQLLALYHPGDVFRSSLRPGIEGEALRALSNGELRRAPWSVVEARAAESAEYQKFLVDKLSKSTAALARHLASIGGLSGPERVAAYLVAEARRSGKASGSGVLLELVPSRVDTADYLALNADTLSRIFGHFQDKGLLQRRGRNVYWLPNLQALIRLVPSGMFPSEPCRR